MTKLYSFIHKPKANSQATDLPTVICIHGLLGSARNLHRLTQAIAESGFMVIAYDQRGHGHSPHNSSHQYDIPSLAKDVFEVMDEHGVSEAHLIGHSLGGRVALAATELAATRIKSLAMLDVGIRIHPEAYQDLKSIIDPLPESFASKADAEQFLSKYLERSLVEFLMSNLRTRDNRQTWTFDLAGIRSSLINAIEVDQLSTWQKLKCPVLVARGSNSEHFRKKELEFMLSKNTNARAVTIPNAGHWLHVDNFVDTLKAITQFLEPIR